MSNRPAQLTVDPDLDRHQHARALEELIDGEVRFGAHDRMLYSTDASIYQVEPVGVVIPASVNDIPKVLAYCAEHGLPVLPRGGGTSLAGQCTSHAVVIDVSAHCTRLLGLDTAARTAHAEAGMTIAGLNRAIAGSGLFFAPDPATVRQANIGGCIGNNAAGTRSIRFGRTSENVVAIDALLPDGSPVRFDGEASDDAHIRRLRGGISAICEKHAALIRERFPKTPRRNAGYALDMILAQLDEGIPVDRVNLSPLICGSEGTLCMTTAAVLKLHEIPAARAGVLFGFASVDEAVGVVPELVGLGASAVELLDDMLLGVARANLETKRYVELMPRVNGGNPGAVLYVEFMDEPDSCAEGIERACGVVGGDTGVRVLEDEAIEQVMALRRAGEPLLHGVPGARKPLGFVEDNAVPVERLSEFVRGFRAIMDTEGTRASFWAHASVGVLHVRPMLSLRDAGDRERMERISVGVADLAQSLGGVMSGEHGDGRSRGPLLERYFGAELMGAFREVKALFDPEGLLNPGNIVSPGSIESIHERTRIDPAGGPGDAPSTEIGVDEGVFFDYSSSEGFGHAVEMCNGSGVCRKEEGGTMCPSYRATRDERHSTRGRANALRLALSGQLEKSSARDGFGDKEVLETLDLCLSCKGCKAECPSNVDVGRYKAEYLAQTYRRRGRVPLRSRLFGDVRRLNRMGSSFHRIANAAGASKLGRAVLNWVMGLAKERSLPRFEESLMRRVLDPESGINAGLAEDAPWVVLFADCFTAYNEPGIGLAAARVLNAMGFCVDIADAGCCGRAAVSLGQLERGAETVLATSARLQSLIERGGAIEAVIALEPSCLSAVRDEWGGLKATKDATADIAARFTSFEEFLVDQWDEPRHAGLFEPACGRVVVHGHCHQKALWGTEATIKMLRKVGGEPEVLDAGCCGMAGSFGMTADHYEVSMRIGESVLLPAARKLDGADCLIASGTSCRHQVLDGAGLRAMHPAEYAASRLREGRDSRADNT